VEFSNLLLLKLVTRAISKSLWQLSNRQTTVNRCSIRYAVPINFEIHISEMDAMDQYKSNVNLAKVL